MRYQPVELLRGVWGLEDRLYTADEIAQSFHLQSAANAGAFENFAARVPLEADTDNLPRGEIDLSNGADDNEARLAAQTLRHRRSKPTGEKES